MPRSRRSSSPIRRPMAERRPSPAPPMRQPAPMPQQQSAVGAPRQGPGLMGQMAATAGGVAIGSVVGHGVSQAIFGGGGGQEVASSSAQQPQEYQQPSYQNQGQPAQVCGWELQQFLNCAQNQQDLAACDGFNEALRQCKRNNGLL